MASYTPNLNLYKPDDSDDYENFREGFNGNMNILDQGSGNQNIAEEYDDTATYAVGNYVIYNGLLYKCDTAVTTAETFDPTKWTHVVVTDEMGSGGGGSGDTVTWNQIQQTGTKIAEIDINGTSQDVYAPQGGGSGSLDAVETTSNAYALLPQADKEDPTKIYFLNDTQSSVIDTPIDQSTFVLKVENQSQMNVAVTNGKLVSVYNYGSSIGACAFEPNAISATASKIKFKFATIGSYDTAQSHAITIGVKANYQSSNWIFSTDTDWLVKKVYDTRNTSVDDYIDLSGITTPCYLMICFHGWTVTFDEFLVEDVSTPTGDTEIRYKNTPYGNNGGGNYYLNTLYSTEEKKIGYWTDGKPLYQCVFDLGSDVQISPSSFTNTSIDASQMQTLIDAWGIYSTGETKYSLMANINNNIIRLQTDRNNAYANVRYVILQYTKTTDTPELNPQTGGVIYLPTIYSDEEREVGVWRDGKPLYQKTFSYTPSSTISATTPITNLSSEIEIKDIQGVCINNQNSRVISLSYSGSNLGTNFGISASNVLQIEIYNDSWGTNYTFYATIKYTKTTDTAGSGTWTPSGELAHHYSTNEQVIGTWTDGKPLYEKTWDNLSIGINGNNWVYFNDPVNIENVISFDAYYNNTDRYLHCAISEFQRSNSNGIMFSGFSGFNRTVNRIVARYTKTTD